MASWKKNRIFERSVEEKSEDQKWAFYDGPPFATGKPHHGHLLAGTIKDVVPRYWAMQGKKIERRFGWDCHGLPIEFETEKRLNLNGRTDIEAYGIDRFNEQCRSIVLRFTQDWQKTVERMGRWIDFENDYKTMDLSFMESVWAVFQKLWDQELIYEDKKVLPYSTALTTPLSNFEANLNYQDVQDPAVTVRLRLVDQPNTSLLIWTTTPWTLPANFAAAVHPEHAYVKVQLEGQEEYYIVSEALAASVFGEQSFTVVETYQGQQMEGWAYEPMLTAFEGKIPPQAHKVYTADYVTQDSGTGIVHLASYGEEDYAVFKRVGLEPMEHLDAQGIVNEEFPLAQGQYFKDANKTVIQELKRKDLLFDHQTIQHSYPFCYRSDTPLIYKPVSTWFVRVTAIKEKLLANNAQTHWVPNHLRDGRFGNWLEGARDWAISRNRFWGNPIPIWRNEDTGETLCVGSKAELEKLSGQTVDDLHKHFIDPITITSPKTGATLTRVPQILDCWFESGSMPYAQQHYPFSTDEKAFQECFPAEFIAEGLDQTRGWFYTLMVLSTALDKGPAFKNVVVNGIVLAEDGRKMSKRLKNYPDPMDVLDQYGADTLRIYLLQSGGVHGEDVRFSEKGLQDMTRKVLLPLYNAYSFLATYAQVDQWDPATDYTDQRNHQLDQWIDIQLSAVVHHVNTHMQQYELAKVIPGLLDFIDDLTNWYIRRSRRRFWKSTSDQDKLEAFSTLYRVLVEFTKLAAPFIPFITEHIYQALRLGHPLAEKDSVHLDVYPSQKPLTQDQEKMAQGMQTIRQVVGLGRELREQLGIKNRQPLATLYVGVVQSDDKNILASMVDMVQEELNVKKVEFVPSNTMARWEVKPNFKQVGKKLGSRMKEFQKSLQSWNADQIEAVLQGQGFEWEGIDMQASDVGISVQAMDDFQHPCHSQGGLVIALDDHLTDALKQEGLVRELINRVQRLRKDSNMEVENRIDLSLDGSKPLLEAAQMHQPLIEKETLSQLRYEMPKEQMHQIEEVIDGHTITLGIAKTAS